MFKNGFWAKFSLIAMVVSLAFATNTMASESCWVDIAEPFGEINMDDADPVLASYYAGEWFDFDQNGEPDRFDHNGDGIICGADLWLMYQDYFNAFVEAYYNGCTVEQAADIVGPSGGLVVSQDNMAEIRIPAGVLGQNETELISVTPIKNGPFSNWGNGRVYDFGPDGKQFNSDVFIKLSYAGMEVEDPSTLQVAYYMDGVWFPVPVVGVDEATKMVEARTDHFSAYWVAPAGAYFENGQSCTTSTPRLTRVGDGSYTCGKNGRGMLVIACEDPNVTPWSLQPYNTCENDPTDAVEYTCWNYDGDTTGAECGSGGNACCYDLDLCVDGGTDCGILKKCVDDDPIPTGWRPLVYADTDIESPSTRFHCVCDPDKGLTEDGDGGCECVEPGHVPNQMTGECEPENSDCDAKPAKCIECSSGDTEGDGLFECTECALGYDGDECSDCASGFMRTEGDAGELYCCEEGMTGEFCQEQLTYCEPDHLALTEFEGKTVRLERLGEFVGYGALIDDMTVLLPASLFYSGQILAFGADDFDVKDLLYCEEGAVGADFTVHYGFNPYSLINDIAILHLDGRMPLHKDYGFAQLDPWSAVMADDVGPIWPFYAETQIIPDAMCRDVWGNHVFDSNICTLDPSFQKGTPGHGPVFLKDGNLVAITSWAFRGEYAYAAQYPAVHTEISYYLTWIAMNR